MIILAGLVSTLIALQEQEDAELLGQDLSFLKSVAPSAPSAPTQLQVHTRSISAIDNGKPKFPAHGHTIHDRLPCLVCDCLPYGQHVLLISRYKQDDPAAFVPPSPPGSPLLALSLPVSSQSHLTTKQSGRPHVCFKISALLRVQQVEPWYE